MADWLKLARADAPPLAYRVEGSGTPLVLVHGVGGDARSWDDVVPRLAPHFRAISLDLRGHGRSGNIAAPCTLLDFARDVTDVMDALGLGACALAGFSLGGQIAQSIALESPERVAKLALISAIAGRTDAERAGLASRTELLKAQGIEPIAAGNRDRWFTEEFQRAHPDKVAARVKQLVQSDPASFLHAFSVFATADLADRLDGIRAPTLIVTGENDAGSTPRMAQLMHGRIRNSELHVLPRLRHSLLIEAPEAIAGLLNAFF